MSGPGEFLAEEARPGVSKGITDSTGAFTEKSFSEGRYTLLVGSPGFELYVNPEFELSCEDRTVNTVDVHLQLGVIMGQLVMIDHPVNPLRRAWLNVNSWLKRVLHSA